MRTGCKALALLLLFTPALANAQGTLEIIPLRHRTVEQVLPVLRPLLEPGGALSGQSNQLFVRTSASNLAEIRAALAAIDTPLRRLQILVRFERDAESARQGARGSSTERVDQRVQVLEGGRAVIATGESRPLRQHNVVRTPGGVVAAESTVMQEIASGIEVVPRLSGNTVLLEIAQRREVAGVITHGSVHVQRAVSTVSGHLGEWFELAGTGEARERDQRGILAAQSAASGEARRIWVKVEELKP
jgi:hypothetical protein